jgi:signal transduction histidine kinase
VWNLTDMAQDVRAVLGAIDADRRIDIESAGAVEASCDGALVRRVIENLVTNALRHTPAGSPIRVSIASAEGRARVAVHDQGRGVPSEATERIFEKFGTVEARQESAYRSLGLGLAFCKLAIEAHGGTIGVAPGVESGSTFWFELPA